MRATVKQIVEWTGGTLVCGHDRKEITGVSTDSRSIRPGEVFVALRGDNFDGHDFTAQAGARGAAALVVEREGDNGEICIRVSDTLVALGAIAHRYRWSEPLIPWVGITGSTGKTTTRELLARILRSRGPVAVSPDNFNNFVGLPFSLLSRPADAWAGVVEIATSAPGEIERLTAIATPTVSVVTNIGPAHLAGLGSLEGVAREKAAIFTRLPGDGLAVYPAGDPQERILSASVPGQKATFAVDAPADMVAENVKAGSEGVSFTVRGVAFRLPLLGAHQASNCLAALLAAERLGVGLEEAARALAGVRPITNRLEMIATGELNILADAYNANPASLQAAVETLRSLDAGRTIAIVGDMLELGTESRRLHCEAGRQISLAGCDVILAVGRESVALAEGAAQACARPLVRHFMAVSSLLRELPHFLQTGDTVLVKGSRGMRMEQVVEALKQVRVAPPANPCKAGNS